MVSHLRAHRTECESRDSADEIVQCDVCRSARTADRVIFHPVNLNEKLHPEPPRGWPRGPKYLISASPGGVDSATASILSKSSGSCSSCHDSAL